MRCEHRQPLLLLHHGVDGPVDARESHGEVVAEAVHGVVGAGRRDPLDGKAGPLRMLGREQAAHKVGVGVHLVVVHPRLRHGRQFDPPVGWAAIPPPKMRCEVLAIGTELLLGQIVDTNSAWIGEQLAASGIDSYEHRVIGDNQTRIVEALRDLLERSDAVLICGGIGPTQDDLTRDAIAELMGVPLVRRMELAEHIATMFRTRLRDMPQNNLRQADVPEGGEPLPNPLGTAPGPVLPGGRRQGRVRRARRAVRDAGDGAPR